MDGGGADRIRIEVNGSERAVAQGTSLRELIAALGLVPEQVAVELNRQLVPRARRDEVRLRAGDRIELVTLVGGG